MCVLFFDSSSTLRLFICLILTTSLLIANVHVYRQPETIAGHVAAEAKSLKRDAAFVYDLWRTSVLSSSSVRKGEKGERGQPRVSATLGYKGSRVRRGVCCYS